LLCLLHEVRCRAGGIKHGIGEHAKAAGQRRIQVWFGLAKLGRIEHFGGQSPGRVVGLLAGGLGDRRGQTCVDSAHRNRVGPGVPQRLGPYGATLEVFGTQNVLDSRAARLRRAVALPSAG